MVDDDGRGTCCYVASIFNVILVFASAPRSYWRRVDASAVGRRRLHHQRLYGQNSACLVHGYRQRCTRSEWTHQHSSLHCRSWQYVSTCAAYAASKPLNLLRVCFRVVSGSRDCTVRLWDFQAGLQLRVFMGHRAAIRCVKFDGRRIVSGGYDNVIIIWDALTGERVHVLEGHTNRVYSLLVRGKNYYHLRKRACLVQ